MYRTDSSTFAATVTQLGIYNKPYPQSDIDRFFRTVIDTGETAPLLRQTAAVVQLHKGVRYYSNRYHSGLYRTATYDNTRKRHLPSSENSL